MKVRGTYQINDSFRITGRGIALAGNLSEGIVSNGDWVVFCFRGKNIKRKITGVEEIRSLKQENNYGLIIETLNDREMDDMMSWKPNGLIASIYS